jgi:hypothetical protein
MGDMAKPVAAVVCCVLLLGQCKADTGTALKTGAGAAGVGAAVGVGVGAGAAAGGAIGGVKRGASKRVEDAISGRNRPTKPRPQPNGPSRPMPATTVPMSPVEKQGQCLNLNGICVEVGR